MDTWQRNVRFNRMVSALPKRSLVIAHMADGSVATVEVSALSTLESEVSQ